MATWSGVSRKLRGVMVTGAVLIAIAAGASVVPFLSLEETEAEAASPQTLSSPEAPGVSVSESMAKRNAELDRMFAELERNKEVVWTPPAPKRKTRRVERYTWEAPADTRARLWNVPEKEADEAITTGLFRICMSEQAGSEDDCIGIWQVLSNIRSRSCNRRFFRKITECDDGGETMLSVMKRASRFVLGVVPARNKRQMWLRELELSCERPESFRLPGNMWDRHLLKRCQRTANIAKRLTDGEPLIITTARVITWGGRCEDDGGACDDRHACERGLARVKGLDTHNAFWCQPGSPGCATSSDPICEKLGYRASRTRSTEITGPYKNSDENS